MSDPALIHEAIIEAAARALQKFLGVDSSDIPSRPWLSQAEAVLAAVTPLIEEAYVRSRATIHVAAIRNAALEEAEQAVRQCSCLDEHGNILATRSVIAAIRALKEQP